MASMVFLIGIEVDLGPLRSQYIIRYWIFFSSSALIVPMTLYNFCPWLNNFSVTYFEFFSVPTTITLCLPKPFLSNCFWIVLTTHLINTIADEKNDYTSSFVINLGMEKDIKDIISKNPVSDIVIALDIMDHEHVMKLISTINGAPVSIKIVPDLYEVVSGLARTEQISGVPLIEVNFQESSWSSSGMKRLFDLFLSSFLLVFLSPFFILVGILIKITSNGPIIYSQERLGYMGKPYWIYKFRSMIVNAEEKSGPVWASDDDPRVTPIGRILRKFRIDELPQLINVFLGQMSLIGPRRRDHILQKN